MPSSFEAFSEQTRPLAMLDERPRAAHGAGPGAALASILLIVLPVLAAVVL